MHIQKAWHFALCEVFRYKKPDTSQKVRSETICITFFNIQKALHFALRNFSCNFWNWRKGGIFINKTMHFSFNIYIKKQCTFCYVFVYKKPDTLLHIFIVKNNSLCVTFLYICVIIYYILIPNYKRTYDQSDQINK